MLCDYDDYLYDGHYDENPGYFDYDDPGDFDSYPDVYGFIEPDDYELYHDLHGPDDCGVYSISRGEASVTSYWTGVEKCDDNEGKVVRPRTGSHESFDSFVRTTGSDELVDSVVRTTGPAEPVNDVTPCWTGDEEYDD